MKPSAKTYSVVIPSYKPGAMIFDVLESVMAQQVAVPLDVVVADSSPEDPTEAIQARYPDVRVVHLKRRTLAGRARTLGAQHAKGDIVFFTDTDCIVDPHWIEGHLEFHRQGYRVVGGGIRNGTPRNLVGTVEYLLEFNEFTAYTRPREVRAVPSCNLSVEREIFDKVGYFPDFLKGEDTLFCENIILSGEKIFFRPDAAITHRNRTSFRHYIKNQIALGEGAVEIRRRARLHGHFLVDFPFLVPLAPLYRTWAIGRRIFTANGFHFLQFLAFFPLIFLGMGAHVWGFIRGPYRAGLSTERPRQRKGRS